MEIKFQRLRKKLDEALTGYDPDSRKDLAVIDSAMEKLNTAFQSAIKICIRLLMKIDDLLIKHLMKEIMTNQSFSFD